jgi:hypothetical protein
VNPLVSVLAVQRLTQLITDDTLTDPIRKRINDWAGDAPQYSFRDQVATLAQCQACISVWAAAGILIASRSRVGRFLVSVLAGSGAALIVGAVRERVER